jgi:biopolymer transport protein ExbD
MAEVQQQESNRRSRRKAYPVLRVDMTPMVDLAFLLLTFFVLTSELKKESAITTRFPADGPTSLVKDPITVLIGKNPEKIFWYRGKFDPSMHLNAVSPDKNGLFKVLSQENGVVYNQIQVIDRQHNLGLLNDKTWSAKRTDFLKMNSVPFVIVKWGADANYGSVVDALDDLNRSDNSKYAVVSISKEEQDVLDKQK